MSRASFAPQQSLISQMVYGFEILKWRKRRKACFQQIEKAHEILYKSAHPALEAASRGDFETAKAMCDRAEEASHKLIALMERCLALCKGQASLEAPTGLRALPATAPASAAESKVA